MAPMSRHRFGQVARLTPLGRHRHAGRPPATRAPAAARGVQPRSVGRVPVGRGCTEFCGSWDQKSGHHAVISPITPVTRPSTAGPARQRAERPRLHPPLRMPLYPKSGTWKTWGRAARWRRRRPRRGRHAGVAIAVSESVAEMVAELAPLVADIRPHVRRQHPARGGDEPSLGAPYATGEAHPGIAWVTLPPDVQPLAWIHHPDGISSPECRRRSPPARSRGLHPRSARRRPLAWPPARKCSPVRWIQA
jgi:hypothetical protein